jgi:membrane-associated protease RseP (regulator of RpoE activity)
MTPVEIEALTPLVARYMAVEGVVAGEEGKNYLVGYLGRLYGDPTTSYDRLAEDLGPFNLTPLFRNKDDQHSILLVEGMPKPKASNPLVNLVLFGLTVVSVLFAGALYVYSGPPTQDPMEVFGYALRHLSEGLPFAASLLAILLAHEFGHYLVARLHGTHVTLPYFIPLPIGFGTMGAFIQMKELPKNKRVLLDIGIAGPLAGLVIALPILYYGLTLSRLDIIDLPPGQGFTLEGNSLLYLLVKFLVFGQLLPSPASYGDLPPLLYWVRYFFTSQPLPVGGVDVMIHPVVWAGWAGLLVTALNLIPAGQLDGGHIMYTLLGKRSRALLPFILVTLVALGFFWNGWWLWAALIYFLVGRATAEPLDQITPLDQPRKALAVIGVLIFILVFTPVPLVTAFAGS